MTRQRTQLHSADLIVITLISLISGCSVAPQVEAKRPLRKPNIIFVLADDLGYGDLSCYGQKKFTTPNIDRLAAEGMRFTQFYAGTTVCAPSRCSLMTGLHTGHTLVRGNKPNGGVPLRPTDLTVAEVLKQAGYATGAFGKWGLGLAGTTGHPNKKGFDEWFGYLDQTLAHDYYADHLWRNSEKVLLNGKHYSHDLIMDRAFDFITQNKDRPFFLYLSITIPHASLEVPADSLEKYRGKFPEKPFGGGGYARQETPRAAFAAMIDRFDGQIGQMMSLLARLSIDDDTIVFFTSDNGPHREGGGDPEFFNSSGPLRGIKRDMYEGGIRVPMIVRWPGRIAPQSTNDYAWAFWDFVPTAAEIAGVRPPKKIDGISVLATLIGKKQREHPCFYWEFYEGGFKQAARCRNWKVVLLGTGKPLELYDLDNDIAEQHDVASSHPDVVKHLGNLLKTSHIESELWPTLSTR